MRLLTNLFGYKNYFRPKVFIRTGRLVVNGSVARLGDRAMGTDEFKLDGKLLAIPDTVERVTLAFYKPKGVETTLKAIEGQRTLANFDFGVGRVFPIGRLDKESHGLLLLTNDGDLGNRLMHPKFQKEKVYLVQLNKKIDQRSIYKLRHGIKILGKMTAPCQVESLSPNKIEITLKEGRNRQIRRMCGALGYEVTDLFRTRFGSVELGDLKPGEFKKVDLK